MASPSSPTLQRLRCLDMDSPHFDDRLCSILHEEEYLQCVSNLKDSDLAWLVDYLDQVGHRIAQTSGLTLR